jgi:hypothetical protein
LVREKPGFLPAYHALTPRQAERLRKLFALSDTHSLVILFPAAGNMPPVTRS